MLEIFLIIIRYVYSFINSIIDSKAIKALTHEQIREFQANGKIEIVGHTLTNEDIKVGRPACAYVCITEINVLRPKIWF